MSVPVLRFKQDDGQDFPDWKHVKVGELGEFIGGGTPSTQNRDFWTGDIPWVSSSDLTEENIHQINTTRFITKDAIKKSATKLVPKNSILIVSRVGVGKVAIASQALCTSQDFTSLDLHSGSYVFFAYLIKIKTNKLLEFNQGTSIKGFVKSDLESLIVGVPRIDEQTKIANFLTAVDEKIQLLTQKHDLLTQYKKGVMQQIFSQELRFKDDDGCDFPEWDDAGFDELFYVANNKKTQIKSSEYLEYGNTPIVDQGQKHIVGYTNNADVYLDVPVIIFGDHTRVLKWIDFTFASGADGTQVLKSTNKLNLKFGYYALCHIELPNLGYSRHMKELKEQFFMIPTSIAEQVKIANFLTAIDDKIIDTQAQLDAVKQYKQGLLQQMFV